MALPPESATDKLLREMRERDQLFKRVLAADPLDEILKQARLAQSTYQRAMGLTAPDPSAEILESIRRRTALASDLAASGALNRTREIAQGYLPSSARQASPSATAATLASPLNNAAQLGGMIRRARKAMKLNQAQFAAQAGVGRRFLSELEGGKPSLEFDKVLACAAAAGIDLLARARRG